MAVVMAAMAGSVGMEVRVVLEALEVPVGMEAPAVLEAPAVREVPVVRVAPAVPVVRAAPEGKKGKGTGKIATMEAMAPMSMSACSMTPI
mgnify:CR=1 FL=1